MSVLTPATLPTAELSAARLDGELFAVDEFWVCADEPDRPELRATALATLLPRSTAVGRLVMMGLTAAWLLGATDAPPWRHEVCSRSDARATLRLPPRFLLRELLVNDDEECRIGGLRVTTPARTAFDLARPEALGAAESAALAALVSRCGVGPTDATRGIRGSLPGAGRVHDRVAALRSAGVGLSRR
jgi:hypothetical protein